MSYSKYTMHKLHFGTDFMYLPPKLSEIWSIYCFPMPASVFDMLPWKRL